MAATVRARSGDAACLARLRDGARGRVHSVFAHAVNVELAHGGWLTLATRGVDDAPDTVVLDLATFDACGLARDDAVLATGERLVVGDRLEVRLVGATAWAAALPAYPSDEARLRRNLAVVHARLADQAARPGGAPPAAPAPVTVVAGALLAQRSAALGQALRDGEPETALAHAEAIVGLGPGLTPSGDDFLLGLFAVLHLAGGPCERWRDLGSRLVARAEGRTNAISRAALRAAAAGQVRQRVVALLFALTTGGREATLDALAAVLAIGATSGRDIVAGLVLGVDVQLCRARMQRSLAS